MLSARAVYVVFQRTAIPTMARAESGDFRKGEVAKGKEHFFSFAKHSQGFWEFDLVTEDELIVNDLTAIDNGPGPSTGLFSFRHRSVLIS
jgi:hypothetical protein